jgi:hypothetical protein
MAAIDLPAYLVDQVPMIAADPVAAFHLERRIERLDVAQQPSPTARRIAAEEALRKIAALLYIVDRGVCKRNNLA